MCQDLQDFSLLPRGDSTLLLSGFTRGNVWAASQGPKPSPVWYRFPGDSTSTSSWNAGESILWFCGQGHQGYFFCAAFQQLLLLSALFSNSWCVQGFCGMNCLASPWLSSLVAFKVPTSSFPVTTRPCAFHWHHLSGVSSPICLTLWIYVFYSLSHLTKVFGGSG